MTGSAPRHLSDESLLLFISGELPDPAHAGAARHLANCDHCRRRLDDTQAMLADLKEVRDNTDLDRFSARLSSLERSRSPWFRWVRPLTAALPAAAVLIGILIWNGSVPTVTAGELVDRAVREESQYPRRSIRCRLLDNTDTCSWSSESLHAASASPSCERIRLRLQSTSWDLTNPLSARSFERWRASLADRHDTVTEKGESVSLRTSTSRGVLRAATLQVRSSDFHPIAATLELEESARIEISELTVPDAVAAALAEPEPSPMPAPVVSASIRPPDPAEALDTAEIQARVALHSVAADRGYETAIRREQQTVHVLGLVRDSARRSELNAALAGIPDLDVRIKTYAEFEPGDDAPFPKGEQGNALPPLAAKWLKARFASLEDSAAFVNRIVQSASAVLGEAAVLDDLAGRSSKLLSTVRQDHQDRMASLLTALAFDVEALTGPLAPPRAVGPDQARTLQSAIIRCFSASRSDSGSLEEEIARIRTVLNSSP